MGRPDKQEHVWYVVVPFPDRETAEKARDQIEEATAYIASISIDGLPGGSKVDPPSDGPDVPVHQRCNCRKAGKWGATGVMPPGHHWHWLNHQHTAGYLAHGDPHRKETAQS